MARYPIVYFRNFIFGVEDSLVSTVGLLSGIATGGVGREGILLTGVVLILVEAFSMAVGSFLTESSVEEYSHIEDRKSRPFWGGIVMFVSYLVAGFIPLTPHIFLRGTTAIYTSIIASLIALFILGLISGSLSHGGLI